MSRFAAILFAASLLAGCATDPLRDVPRLSEADVSDADAQAAIRAEPGDTPLAETSTGSAQDSAIGGAAPDAPRGGLLGFLSRAAREAQTPEGEDATDVAAIPPQTQSDAPAPGLFGGGRSSNGPKPGDPDYQIVEMGTVLPYGTLARVCNVPTRQLGTRVERYPERRSTYAIYDSQPGNTAPHTFYVTGFDDGCARQFTAALAMFGSPETHEQLRYGLPSQVQPYSSTDAAYETLKSRVCRVGKGKPCGSAMSRLARDTVFVSVYERFGSNPVWKTILLHDGEVVETDIRGN
ncbi:hypothetical protein [uncultured Marivita sp.]|uniref:hypothetical protein n=1 Tax=uncultured Marivita sp. TaxID=888080 RepID=UPI00260D179C|nr:hypothetical protein [uncultured Marivita sp.]